MRKYGFILGLGGMVASILLSAPTLAQDSTSSVVSSLTSNSSFSTAPASTAVRIYKGKTSGRVNFPSGYKTFYVNGVEHTVGKGNTIITVQGAESKYYTSDCTPTDNRCQMSGRTAKASACIITITDRYVVGCNTQQNLTSRTCRNGHCSVSGTEDIGTRGNIYSVTGER
ncbi:MULTISPECIES: hypothetical protein [Vibrio]|uniref:hypothetical protein n=1 Tax=Vibrio TaxID=662 RepID=UPI001054FDD4|nr:MULTISPECIES: hypothetical protein [Vibrio]MCC4838060.1 hypothetical protein [Vibrio lentus]